MANSGDNSVSILLGNGNGTFTTSTLNSTNGFNFNNPVAIVAGNFGNGQEDLGVVNKGNNTVSILLGNGKGTFTLAATLTTGSSPTSIAAADFNNDGKLDLVVTNSASDTVSVFLGNGNGTFATPLTYTVGIAPASVVTSDFNQDDFADIAVANSGSNNVSILFGMGGGQFASAVNYPVGPDPVALAVGDLNYGGNLDLAVVNAGSNTVTYLSGYEDGSFVDAGEVIMTKTPRSIALADFNGDQNTDAVVAYNDPGLIVYLASATMLPGVQAARESQFATVAIKNFDTWINDIKSLRGFDKTTTLNAKSIDQLFTYNVNGANIIDNLYEGGAPTQAEKADAQRQAAAIDVIKFYNAKVKDLSFDWLPPWEGVTKRDLKVANELFGKGDKGANALEDAYDFAFAKITLLSPFRDGNVLFKNRVPDYKLTHQGLIGDCHFISAVDALAYVRPADVVGGPPPRGQTKGTGLVWRKWNTTAAFFQYWVQWPKAAGPSEVNPPTLSELGYYAHAEDGLWLTILDKAYGDYRGANAFYSLLDNTLPASFKGGDMIQNSIKLLAPSNKVDLRLLNKVPVSNQQLYTIINQAITNKKMITAGTFRVLPQIFGSDDIPYNGHAYTVLGVSPGGNPAAPWDGAKVWLRNPWGNAKKYGNTFAYPINDFRQNFFAIAFEK